MDTKSQVEAVRVALVNDEGYYESLWEAKDGFGSDVEAAVWFCESVLVPLLRPSGEAELPGIVVELLPDPTGGEMFDMVLELIEGLDD